MRRGRPAAAFLLLLLLLPLLAGGAPRGAAPGEPTEGTVALPECGQRPLFDSTSGSRILGGQEAQTGEWPWTVSLQIHQSGLKYRHVCGGVLVNEKSVVTAAHCVTGRKDPYSWRAVLGVRDLRKYGKQVVRRSIRRISVHAEFKTDTFENDLALFELDSAARYSDYIQPICLPPPDLHPETDNDTECFISGWGRTSEKGKMSSVLKAAQVEIIPHSICNRFDAYGGLVNNNMICAGSQSGGTDTCQGDSGGPLACYHPSTSRYYLIGITSYGLGCGRPNFPGIYVRLSQYREWIKSELLLRNKSGNPVSTTLPVFLTAVCVVLV